jgi:hypothetical protein
MSTPKLTSLERLRVRIVDYYRGTLGDYILRGSDVVWEGAGRDPFRGRYRDLPVLAQDAPGEWIHPDAGEAWLRRLKPYLDMRGGYVWATILRGEQLRLF